MQLQLLYQCRQQLQEIQQRHHLLERGTVMQAHRIVQARRAETSKVTLSLKAGP